MNHDEIEDCVVKAKNGDSEATMLIIDQFKPFIFKACREFRIKGQDICDLVQTGYMALIKAIEKYKLGSHTFSSYAYTTIKNSLKYLARSCKKYNNVQSLNARLDKDSNTEYIDVLESEENIECDYLQNSDYDLLRTILATLSVEDFELIFLVYYNNVSLKTYSKKRDISYLCAVRKRDRILLHIKKEYCKRIKQSKRLPY